MRKLQVIKLTDTKEFEEHVNEFVSTHKIINITYAIKQGYAGVHMNSISALVAFIEYEETDGTEPKGRKSRNLKKK